MRLAIDIRSLTAPHKTGVGIVTEALVSHLAKQAPQDEIMLFATGSQEATLNIPVFREPNIHRHFLPLPNKLASLLWRTPGGPTMEYFLPKKPDVWLFPHAHLLRTHLPYVVLFHDASLRTVPNCFQWKDHLRARIAREEHIFHHAKRVVAVSEHSARDATKFYGVSPSVITVAQLGVEHTQYLPREQASDRAFRAAYDLNIPYLLCVATREPRKNIDSVIRAYDIYRRQGGANIPLVLAGAEGWRTEYIQHALAASPHRQDIREIFYVPEKHKPALYRGAKAFVFPSFYEGFGLPVLEAMACGTPVITSITSALPDVVDDAALLIDPHNVTDIARAINALLTDNPLHATLRARGILRAQQFSWEKPAQIVLQELHRAHEQNQ